MKEDKCVTIRNNFLRCQSGVWINMKNINRFYVVHVYDPERDKSEKSIYADNDFVKSFDSNEEAQKFLDELIGIRVEDFIPVSEYEYFSIRIENALRTLGCKTMGEAKKIRRIEWQQTPGVSMKSWDELQNVLDEVYGRK